MDIIEKVNGTDQWSCNGLPGYMAFDYMTSRLKAKIVLVEESYDNAIIYDLVIHNNLLTLYENIEGIRVISY